MYQTVWRLFQSLSEWANFNVIFRERGECLWQTENVMENGESNSKDGCVNAQCTHMKKKRNDCMINKQEFPAIVSEAHLFVSRSYWNFSIFCSLLFLCWFVRSFTMVVTLQIFAKRNRFVGIVNMVKASILYLKICVRNGAFSHCFVQIHSCEKIQ